MSASFRFLRGVSSAWISIIVVAATQIVQIRMARHQLPEAEFALFGVLSNLVAAFLIAEVGVRAAFARLLIEARHEGGEVYKRFWASAALVFKAQGAVITIITLACAPFIDTWFRIPEAQLPTVRSVFLLLGVTSALGYAFGHHSVSLLATQHFVLPNILTSIAGILGLVIFAIGMRAGCGLYSFPLSLAPHLIAACLAFPFITRRRNIAPTTSVANVAWNDIRRIFVLGFDLFWIALYNLILGHTLLLYGGMILSAAQIAILTVNLKLVQFALQVAQRLPGTAEPILAQMVTVQDLARFRAAWFLSAKSALGATLLGTGILYLWAGFAIHYWTSDADIMQHWALLLVCLLPFRYILHTVCVLGCTLFKAASRMRLHLVWELILYTVLAFPLGHKFGVGGLLAASLISLAGGSLVPGIRLIQQMGQFPPGSIPRAVLKTIVPTLTSLLVVVAWFPQPEQMTLAIRCAVTAGWTLLTALLLWFIALDSAERRALDAKLGAFRRKSPPAV